MRLTFNVNRGDYGSHYYGSAEALLDRPPSEYHYYTTGNLSGSIPNYVVNPPKKEAGDKRDRIIIRVQRQNIGQGGTKFISGSTIVAKGQITIHVTPS